MGIIIRQDLGAPTGTCADWLPSNASEKEGRYAEHFIQRKTWWKYNFDHIAELSASDAYIQIGHT
jgi:hypothetical protein